MYYFQPGAKQDHIYIENNVRPIWPRYSLLIARIINLGSMEFAHYFAGPIVNSRFCGQNSPKDVVVLATS